MLLVVVILVIPVFSFGALLPTKSADVPLLQDGNYDIYTEAPSQTLSARSFGASTLSIDYNYTEVSDYIYESLLNVDDSINVYDYRISTESMFAIYTQVINEHPDLFYVSSSISFNYVPNNNCVYQLFPQYSLSASEIDDAKRVFNAGVSKAMECIDPSMSNMQMALALHDYVCENALYIDNGEISHSAYGFFYDGNIVCAGYTLAYAYLLSQVGIETEHITSSAMAHAWNAVCIDNQWYNCDLTYDDSSFNDPQTQKPVNLPGGYGHNYFMKSREYFHSVNGGVHYGEEIRDTISLNDKKYDNYFWNDIYTKIPVVNGEYYYMQPTDYNSYLVKQDENNNVTIVSESSFYCAYLEKSANHTDENGNVYQFDSVDHIYRLEYLDDRFYLASGNGLLSSIDMEGYVQTIIPSTNDYILGIKVVDEQLELYLFMSLDSPVTLDKIEYFNNYKSLPNSSVYNNYPDINNDDYVNAKDYALITK